MWGDSKSKFSRKKVKKDGEASQDNGEQMIEVIGLENCLHMGQVT